MTLDEAIKHAEEVMTENLEKTKDRNASDPIAINCFECAEEHQQLAEWLTELKFYKMAFGKIEERLLGIVCYKGRIFKSFDDDLVLKTQDKNGMCSFYGFREVDV